MSLNGKEIANVNGISLILPQSRNVWVICIGASLICFTFYYFYGGYITLGIIFAVILTILYQAQDVLLYHPDLPANSRIFIPIPTMHNLPHENITIRTTDNVTLHAFWLAQPEERSKSVPTFVYFHGNAGNMGHRMQNVWGIFHELHCNVLMVEYRGYGLSSGTPSERGFQMDARAAIDYLYTRHDLDHTQIVLFGRSLGGAVVIDVAADTIYAQKVMCAIVENTFTSISEIAVELVHPYAKYIPNFCLKNKYKSIWKISKCSIPFLFVSGLADHLVPPRMMRTLYNCCGSTQKQLLEFVGGSHNDTWTLDGYYAGLKLFLENCQGTERTPLQVAPGKRDVWLEIQQV